MKMVLLLLGIAFGLFHLSFSTERPNVLFLMADDMKPNLEILRGDPLNGFISPQMHTPNLDSLARKSLVLQQAFVQQAICAPSRASLLTGRRPDTTHVYGFKNYWRESGGNFTTIPQYFKENGYVSAGVGKIFHPGRSSNNNDPLSWSLPYLDGKHNFENRGKTWEAIPDWKLNTNPLVDEQIADGAIMRLRNFSATRDQQNSQPFFLAVGFYKPHLPFVFPKSMLEKYPMSSVRVPDNPYAPIEMPQIAWHNNGIYSKYPDIRRKHIQHGPNVTVPDNLVKELRRAYYCALSWADHQLGRVHRELDELGFSDNTIIAFLSDHGYELGEHGLWTKFSNFELALRANMMLHIPGTTDKMIKTKEITEFVDIFPSLVEATGFDPLPLCPKDSSNVKLCREGTSFISLIQNPETPIKRGAFSQAPREQIRVMGYSIRTPRYRYTEWARFMSNTYQPEWDMSYGVELYDHLIDSEENRNVATQLEYEGVKRRLRRMLHEGWRAAQYSEVSTNADQLLEELANPYSNMNF